ncbi:CaiB/BaiF CoA transferase family protein [Acinetobacter sp. ANC 3813]|uniref:CaiB/BaiF CoA transferase family protein n=1 Tax=Acinetobacter sp. ANC 3813 TaxID=1977873 RepID=UPI000A341814|nr:CaiB/BaiF CoA-transferase family protein [Acinetobacter sp. ANC 3813]OTG91293.1 CoA transferase [Acinetobacter sp. ANC 3813]
MGTLEGIRVLDLSRILAGPWCGQILADLGAEVIKVERPKVGDDTRMWGPPWMKNNDDEETSEGAYFQAANRNKHSISVDISTAEGQAIVRKLAQDSDVLIENYKAGSLKNYGLDYESLKEINPKLVYCSITGFGQDGPRAEEPGYDYIIQGIGGLMSVTGDKEPMKTSVAFADLNTGLYSAIAIQAAIINRFMTGQGQHIDMALLDVQVACLANIGMNYISSGEIPKRYGNAHANVVPYQVFRAYDQDFIVACGNDKQFVALCSAIELPDLSKDSRFITNALRLKNRDDIVEILSTHFLTQTAKHWVDVIQSVKVPVGVINNLQQTFEEPQVKHRKMLVEMKHPLKDKLQVIASPMKFSRTPVQYRKAPPMLGEDTNSILSRYLGKDEIENLRVNGIVG